MAAKTKSDEKTYVVTMKDDTVKRITVPASWKVTFGPLSPGSKNHNENGSGGTALRFYEGRDQQRAVFVNVLEFRDASIPILEKVEDTQTEQVARKDKSGNLKNFTVQAKETKWVNPDAEGPATAFTGVPPKLVDYLRDEA